MKKIIQLAKSTLHGKDKEDIYPKTTSAAVSTNKPEPGDTLDTTLEDLYSKIPVTPTPASTKVHIVLVNTTSVNYKNVAFFCDSEGELDSTINYNTLEEWVENDDIIILKGYGNYDYYMLTRVVYRTVMNFSMAHCLADSKSIVTTIKVKPDETYFDLISVPCYKPLKIEITQSTSSLEEGTYNNIVDEVSEFGRPIYIEYTESGVSYHIPFISVRTDLENNPIQFGKTVLETALGTERYIGISIYDDDTVGILN